jgi:DNA-binding NarL/FixJ family response regulator
LNYLARLLPRGEFTVVDEHEAYERRSSSLGEGLVLAIDEKGFAPWAHRCLRVRYPGAKLLMLAVRKPRGEECQLLLGVDGLVLYSEARTELVPALRALRDGHLWFPPEVLEYLVRLALRGNERQTQFTLRETEIIRLIGEGLCNKEIGARLGITEKTVKFHASNVFAKLGVHDRNSAIEAVHTLTALRERGLPLMQSLAKRA